MTTILALLSALPKILELFSFITRSANDAQQRGLGRREAIAEGLQVALNDLTKADEARQEAKLRHSKDKTDKAFDDQFKRND